MLRGPHMRISTRVGTALAVAGLVAFGALAAQTALAASGPPPADPVAHALGLDNAALQAKVSAAQLERSSNYQIALATCLRAAGFTTLPDVSHPTATGPAGPPNDPIVGFARSLSAADRLRFGQAIQGPGGCDAHAKVTTESALLQASDAYDATETDMYSHLAADPRVKAAASAWQRCIGGGFASPADIASYLASERSALVSGVAGKAAIDAQAATLQAKDLACQQQFVDPVYQPLLQQARSAFVAAHGKVISDLKTALSAG